MGSRRRRVPVAIAHDYLTQRGGAERVVLALSRAYPQAPIYTTLYDPDATYPEFAEREIITSPLNRVGPLRTDHRRALPFLARAVSDTRIDADITIASSTGWAHGFTTTGKLLVYCHNPARWLYQTDEYLGETGPLSPKRLAVAALGPSLRRWDKAAAIRADRYLANSTVVRQRILSAYGIYAPVLFPPPGLAAEGQESAHPHLADWGEDGYWLVVSRLMPYKNVDVAIDAFRDSGRRLVIVGSGPERERLLAMAPDNVRLVSDVSDAELRWIYGHAQGLVAPSREDFGLTPLEANARGLPVAALRAGGYLDTVADGLSGLFFRAVEADAVRATVQEVAQRSWDADAIRAHAESFAEPSFIRKIRAEVEGLVESDR